MPPAAPAVPPKSDAPSERAAASPGVRTHTPVGCMCAGHVCQLCVCGGSGQTASFGGLCGPAAPASLAAQTLTRCEGRMGGLQHWWRQGCGCAVARNTQCTQIKAAAFDAPPPPPAKAAAHLQRQLPGPTALQQRQAACSGMRCPPPPNTHTQSLSLPGAPAPLVYTAPVAPGCAQQQHRTTRPAAAAEARPAPTAVPLHPQPACLPCAMSSPPIA